MERDKFFGFKRLVIKIGSALLNKDGTFNNNLA